MNSEVSFQTAFEQHEAGNLDEAERIYREILQREPGNADVLHLLGVLLFQKKDPDGAIDLIKQSIEHDPSNEEAYYNLAGILQDVGKLDEAITYYQKVIDINPDLADTYNSLGAVLQRKGQIDDAIANLRKAIELNPGLAMTHFNLGYLLQQKGQIDDAIASYRKAIEIKPDFDDAHYNLGVVFQAQGRLNDAMAHYCASLRDNPDNADILTNIGIILKVQGQDHAAAASFRNALAINPNLPDVWYKLGHALEDINDLEGAISAYKKVTELNPESFQAHCDLGNALKEQGNSEEAISAYDRSLILKPDLFKARWARCMAHLPVVYPDVASIERARAGYSDELVKMHGSLSLDTPQDIDAASEAVGSHQPFYLAAQGLNDKDLQKIYGEMACGIMAAKYPQWAERPSMPSVSSREPIRVGIVSGHFFHHSVWKIPMRGWIENFDRNKFNLYCYYTEGISDDVTEYARQTCTRFTEGAKSFEMLCQSIKEDNLHILIFPEIGMNSTTLRLASLRLAPVQCTTMGHPDTSGLPTMDYYLSSELMEPADGDDHYTESLVRLPNVSFFYIPLEIRPAAVTRETFSLRKDSILYLCSHAVFTHLPQYDEIYVRIAQQVPDSQFIFIEHYTKHVTDRFRTRLSEAFGKFKVDADRHIVFLHEVPQEEYLAINGLSHVFLDTPGWSGNNSTLEAIANDLPVVTLPGSLMRQRHSYGVLKMMGVTDTIVKTVDEYVELAVRLGKDSEFRRHISEKISASKHNLYHDKTCIITLKKFFEKVVRKE